MKYFMVMGSLICLLGNAQANRFEDFDWEKPLNTFKTTHTKLKEAKRKEVVGTFVRNVHEAFYEKGYEGSEKVIIPLDPYDYAYIKLLPQHKTDFIEAMNRHFEDELTGFDINSFQYAIPRDIS